MIYIYLVLAFALGYVFHTYWNTGTTLKSYVLGFIHGASGDISIVAKLPKELLAEMGIGIKEAPTPLKVVRNEPPATD